MAATRVALSYGMHSRDGRLMQLLDEIVQMQALPSSLPSTSDPLLRAVEMLAQGERIIDIALEAGYRSPTAFSTMFQRQFGCIPSVFFSENSEAAGRRDVWLT